MNIGKLIKQSQHPFFSLEYFPPSDPMQMAGFFETAEELGSMGPLFVSVTYGAGGKKQDNTLKVTGELASRGYETMAHLTCVGADPEAVKSFINKLKDQGVTNILALRGDPPANQPCDWNRGYFKHAVDLVRFIRRESPETGIGVAAYPAPHPESGSFENDRRHTAEKLEAGADFAITQMFFDPREYIDLASRLKAAKIDVPVIPGVMTIQSLEGLKRILSLCDANIPGKLYLELEAANDEGGAAAVRKAGFEYTIKLIRRLLDAGAPGIHLYTLNKSELCKSIIEASALSNIQ